MAKLIINLKPIQELKEAQLEGAYITAEQILTQSIINCPRDTGVLRNSHALTFKEPNSEALYAQAKGGPIPIPKLKGNETEIYLSANTPYARKQHEDTTLNHPKEGEAKYLEKAWNALIGNIENNIQLMAKKKGLL